MAAIGANEGGEAWLVLGDMRELGEDGAAMHAEAGRRAKAAGIARLYTLGDLSAAAAQAFGTGASHYDSHDALAEALRRQLSLAGDPSAGTAAAGRIGAGGLATPAAIARVLVKGSRGSAMDRIVTALLADTAPADAPPTGPQGDTDAA